jgi:protein-tyrosine phosphatase
MPRLKRWLQGQAPSAPTGGDEGAATRVLMVCMGNICRSPIAEGVLRTKLQRAGLGGQVLVDSAGTHGYHTGEPPDPRSVRVAARRGYDIAPLRARPVRTQDYAGFDWLLAMDEANVRWLQEHAPASGAPRIELLLSHALRHAAVREVPDPYYGAEAGFERVLDLVEDACDGVLLQLQRGQAPRQGAKLD